MYFHGMDIPVIEQVKIQARVLIPLVKALRAELGEERANDLVRKALGETFRKLGENYWQARRETDLGKNMAGLWERFAAGDALDYHVLRQSPDAFDIDITGCRYAQFYQALGEPELGFLMVCSQDSSMARGFGPDIELKLTQTIMQGANHCDFRYARRKHGS